MSCSNKLKLFQSLALKRNQNVVLNSTRYMHCSTIGKWGVMNSHLNDNRNDIYHFTKYFKSSSGTGHVKFRARRKMEGAEAKYQAGEKKAKERKDADLTFYEKQQKQIEAVQAKQKEREEKLKAQGIDPNPQKGKKKKK